jgi:hypothetical protein
MRNREFKRDRHLPARYERLRIVRKDVYNEGAFNAFGLCGGEDLQRVRARGNQSIALYRYPLTGKGTAVLFNPQPLRGAIAVWALIGRVLSLQAICKAQHFFLLRLRKVTNFIEDGFFQIHWRPFR